MKKKKFTMTMTENEEGMFIEGENDGFNALELLGLFEFKRQDIIDQLNGLEKKPITVTRIAIVDGVPTKIEVEK